MAAKYHYPEVVQSLLSVCDTSYFNTKSEHNEQRHLLIHIAIPRHEVEFDADRDRVFDTIETLLKHPDINPNELNTFGRSPLSAASNFGRIQKLLLRHQYHISSLQHC